MLRSLGRWLLYKGSSNQIYPVFSRYILFTKAIKISTIADVLSVVLFLSLVANHAPGYQWQCSSCGSYNPSSATECTCGKPKGAVGGGSGSGSHCSAGAMGSPGSGLSGALPLVAGSVANNIIIPAMGSSSNDFIGFLLKDDHELPTLVRGVIQRAHQRSTGNQQPQQATPDFFGITVAAIGSLTNGVYSFINLPWQIRTLILGLSNPARFIQFQPLILNINQLSGFQSYDNNEYAIQAGLTTFYLQNPSYHGQLLLDNILKALRAIWLAVAQYNILGMISGDVAAAQDLNAYYLSLLIQLQLNQDLVSPQAALEQIEVSTLRPSQILPYRRIVERMSQLNFVQELDCQQIDSLEHLLKTLRTILTAQEHTQLVPYVVQVSFFAYQCVTTGVLSSGDLHIYIIWFKGRYRIQIGSYISPVITQLEELGRILKYLYEASLQRRNSIYAAEGIEPLPETEFPLALLCQPENTDASSPDDGSPDVTDSPQKEPDNAGSQGRRK